MLVFQIPMVKVTIADFAKNKRMMQLHGVGFVVSLYPVPQEISFSHNEFTNQHVI